MAQKKQKTRVTISISPDVLRRVDRVAKSMRISRSAWLEHACLGELDQAELFVKLTQQPELMQTLLGTFGDRSVMRQMAEVMGDELTDAQMQLFTQAMKSLTEKGGGK